MLNIEGSCLWKRFRPVLSLRNSLRNRFALFAHLSEHHFVPDLPSSGWKMEEGDLDLQTRRCLAIKRALKLLAGIGGGPFSRALPRLHKRYCIEADWQVGRGVCQNEVGP